ncbi:MAG TPA: hypothetical protein VNN73_21430 [Blastocatellia bacterium]|jgi:hypothetical protein|nr:hypothetical protein [Blastocatellia bacterium]
MRSLISQSSGSKRTGGWEGYIKTQINYLKRTNNSGIAWQLARFYALLGNKRQALDHLELAYESHYFLVPFVGAAPLFDDLRGEPRYQDLLQRLGLTRWLEQR